MISFLKRVASSFIKQNASYSLGGQLHIPAVDVMVEGQKKTFEVNMRIISEAPLQFEVVSITPPIDENDNNRQTGNPTAEKVSFVCNVCARQNNNKSLAIVRDREAPSCEFCGSSLRIRSVIHAVSKALFERSIPIPEFPTDKNICGIGMSDWPGYATKLSEKLQYTNTFYHTEPHLDIMNIEQEKHGMYDFVISSDVFEHIMPPVSKAFENTFKLLKPGGVFILTVPFSPEGKTLEYFPDLHDYRIEEQNNHQVLINTTSKGQKEVFHNLIFHGGDGFTLEMRLFSEPDLIKELTLAGFTNIQVQRENQPEYGIIWPITWAVPIVARKAMNDKV